jgi:hypothetical protein
VSESPIGPDDAALVEPARQRLLSIAADVLGRLPADETPSALRPIARFAPAKRARLGATVLAAALDLDPDFRARIADVVQDGSPQLVDAVRGGTSLAASDPLDVGIVAYLFRPDGWQRTLAAANARWSAERGSAHTEASEADRLRAEATELRSRLKTEAVRQRAAVTLAVTESAEEIAELKRQLRARTGELRAAERAQAQAESVADAAGQGLLAAEAAHAVELRRIRARITELERAVESSRRESRAGRELDDARLWLLAETLTEAAGGIRRELSLAPPSLRPADAVAAGAAAPTASTSASLRSAADPAALDRLLALPHVHVIIDGYNVTKTGYGDLPLAAQRTRLIGAMASVGGRSGAEITIAFDGGTRPPAQPPVPRGVRVLFTAGEEIADDLIRRLVAAEPPGRPLVVITSDQQVVTDAQRAGAWTVPSSVLIARLG